MGQKNCQKFTKIAKMAINANRCPAPCSVARARLRIVTSNMIFTKMIKNDQYSEYIFKVYLNRFQSPLKNTDLDRMMLWVCFMSQCCVTL